MQKWNITNALTRIYSAAGRKSDQVTYEVWSEALADVELSESQTSRAATDYIRNRDLAKDGPSPASFREAALAVLRRDEMRAAPTTSLPGAPWAPTKQGALWISHIRNELAKIGNGGVPMDQRKHTSENWEACPECKRVASKIAIQASR